MNMSGSGVRLAALTRDLLVHWRQTREHWVDQKAREFEDRFIGELESSVNSAVTGIAEVERVLRKISEDCE